MAYLAVKQANDREWIFSAERCYQIGKILISFVVSVSTFAGVIIFGYKLSAVDGIQIPVIHGPLAWRRHPVDSGGSVTNKTGYTLNNLLVGKSVAPPSAAITLADHPVQLTDEDISAREFAEQKPHVEFEWLAERQLNLGQYSASNLYLPASGNRSGQQVDAADIPVGQVLVQFGAFKSYALAKNEWRKLILSIGKHLNGRDWLIEPISTAGSGELYRLRVVGFSDWKEATVFCGRLSARGADCSPVVTN